MDHHIYDATQTTEKHNHEYHHEKKKSGGNQEMKELATRFIGKECVVCFFDGNQRTGVITEVTDGAILLEKNGKTEALNLDFVLRINESPKKKK